MESGPLTILADPTQIHRALMNPCSNATQAMEEAGGVLKISLDSVPLSEDETERLPNVNPGSFARLTVQDNGQGIDREIKAFLMKPLDILQLASVIRAILD